MGIATATSTFGGQPFAREGALTRLRDDPRAAPPDPRGARTAL